MRLMMARQPVGSNPFFHRITILGLGLIGGSFALAIKRHFSSVFLTGLDSPAVLRSARRVGAIDRSATNLSAAVKDADLVLVATPPAVILEMLPELAATCPPTTIVMDTGSVKEPVVKLAAKLFPAGNFVGAHPMAGSEQSGFKAARADLFEDAPFLLCPTSKKSVVPVQKLRHLISALGAHPVVTDAKRHDKAVALFSHLPQVLSVALANAAATTGRRNIIHFAGRGFYDMTRLAGSPYSIWRDILGQNRENVLRAIGAFREELRLYEELLRGKKLERLGRKFHRANMLQKMLARRRR